MATTTFPEDPQPLTAKHKPDLHVLDRQAAHPPLHPHPRAGEQMMGAEMLMQVFVDEGVDTVFGYSGGAILPAYDALYRHNETRHERERLRLLVAANEQGAGFMAAGYARASGKVGVLMVTSGPGATNCVTPVRDSMADSVPMVMISGQVARSSIGTDAFQEAPVHGIMAACAKHVFLVEREEELEATIRSAFAIAREGRPGPVVIDLPKDVQNHLGTFHGHGMLDLKGYQRRLKGLEAALLSKESIDAFFDMMESARRPVLYVGGGAIISDAAPELKAFAHKFSIPVVTTLMGIGSFDTTDPLALGMLGMHGTAYANYAVDDCDLLIAVGARFDDRVAGNVADFAGGARIAHIDLDAAEIGKVKRVHWSHAGDAKAALAALTASDRELNSEFNEWAQYVQRLKREHALRYNEHADIIQPQHAIATLNNMTKGQALICTGVGQHQMFSALYFDFHQPRSFLTSGCMGTMGFGLPAAIGAKLACPDKLVIDVDGDGSMRMNIGELETATTYNIPIKILLLNNRADGMVWQWQDIYYGRRFSGTDKAHRTKNFIKEAQANGFEFARRVTDHVELKPALEAWLAVDGPAFLEVMVDREAFVYPMIGPGQSYSQMQTGPYISAR